MAVTHEGAPRKRKTAAKNPAFKYVEIEDLKGEMESYSKLSYYTEVLGYQVCEGYENKRMKRLQIPYDQYLARQKAAEDAGNNRVKPRKTTGDGLTDEIVVRRGIGIASLGEYASDDPGEFGDGDGETSPEEALADLDG